MRVLVACEFSGIVREAFTRHGHDAWSVDYEATEIAGNHYSCDLFDVVQLNWDMILAFPPCTYLARSGARWHSGSSEQHAALDFVKRIMALPIKRICVENPIGAINRSRTLPGIASAMASQWGTINRENNEAHL